MRPREIRRLIAFSETPSMEAASLTDKRDAKLRQLSLDLHHVPTSGDGDAFHLLAPVVSTAALAEPSHSAHRIWR